MARVLGLDVGTTTVSGVIVATSDGQLVARAGSEHRADVVDTSPDRAGWAEQDPHQLDRAARQVLSDLAAAAGPDVAAIGLTGQMHGLLLLDADGQPLGNLITWQDRRAAPIIPELLKSASAEAWTGTGCQLATGYLAATLAWMVRNAAVPTSARRCCFIHDWLAARLGGSEPCTDPSDAGSVGIFDLAAKAWSDELIAALGLPVALLPPIRESGAVIGHLQPAVAKDVGLRSDVPVCNAIGDNQASFLGSVGDPEGSVLVNIGTGGQISWVVDDLAHPPGMEIRYLPNDRLIAVGAGICGGRTYAWLEAFYREVVAAFTDTGAPAAGQLYERMNELAAAAPADAAGLRCRPTLSGTRQDPDLRGLLDGLDLTNMTPANLTRAVLTGIVDELRGFYRSYDAATLSAHRAVVGSGNAIRRNRALANIIAERFGMPVRTPRHHEEAAYGAALLAAVTAGVLPDLATAGQLIRYETVAE